MYRRAHHLFVAGLTLVSLATAAENSKTGTVTVAADLHSFTNVAYISTDADPSSIRFESIKPVSIATSSLATADPRTCNDDVDAGGCSYVQFASPSPAYRITYSFKSRPMASDEYANTHFTFSVYFRPDDLSATVRRAVDSGRLSRNEAASLFKVTSSPSLVQRVAIDEANSTFCEGDYVDGSWMPRDRSCEDKPAYRTVTSASSYVAVKIDVAAGR